MNDLQHPPGHDPVPAQRRAQLPARLTYASRGRLLRAAIIFEIKLALDGLKDIVLAPLAIVGAVVDILTGDGTEAKQLRRVLLLGERYEGWLNLYGSRAGRSRVLADAGSDVLIDEVERKAADVSEKYRQRRELKKEEKRRGRGPRQ